MQLNIFRASSRPTSGATTTAVAASGLPSELGDSSAVVRGRAGRPDHDQGPVPIVQEAGWAPGPVWTDAENLAIPGFDPRTAQPVTSRYTPLR
jgi:hypothetical protein